MELHNPYLVLMVNEASPVFEWGTVSALMRGLFWCLFPELRGNEGNKYQNNTPVSAETVRHESTYINLFLTRYNESINDAKNDDLYTSSQCLTRSVFVLLMTSQSIADDVKMTDNCDAIKWIVIFKSLDIDFIHGDINGSRVRIHFLEITKSCLSPW